MGSVLGGRVGAYGFVSQRLIRARSDAMLASWSFLAVAAHRVALRTEVELGNVLRENLPISLGAAR